MIRIYFTVYCAEKMFTVNIMCGKFFPVKRGDAVSHCDPLKLTRFTTKIFKLILLALEFRSLGSHRFGKKCNEGRNFAHRSSCQQMLFKIVVVKNFPNFMGKNFCRNLFFNKIVVLQVCNCIKNDSITGFFLRNLQT